MNMDTCDRCVHCTHVHEDGMIQYFYCEIDGEYISEDWALNPEIGCDGFVEKLDDNETEESSA